MAKYVATTSSEISEREKRHLALVRKIAAQGMVLLENDGVLPLKGKAGKIALYGNGARKTQKGGSGSGDMNSRFVVNMEQGFENAGYTVVTKAWLDEYDEHVIQSGKEYMEGILKKAAESGEQNPMMLLMGSPFVPSDMRPLRAEELPRDTDTACYVLSRRAGEGADRYNKEGDYLLTENEIHDITLLAAEYDKFILLLNVGGVIDTKAIRSVKKINAVLLMSQAGAATGDAVVDVLTGKVTPSGKLTSTWAENYSDYPTAEHFSHNDGDLDESYYEEGIYVGYRYFDSFGVTPAYCFGYGLSYTTFAVQTRSVTADEREIAVTVAVKNTGACYAGQEVVQIYVSAPEGTLDKPYQELKAYKKTKVLASGEEEVLTIRFDTASLASYSEAAAAWILEKGAYAIRVGTSSRDTHIAAVLKLDRDAKTVQCRTLFGAAQLKNELKRDNAAKACFYNGEDEEKRKAPAISLCAEKMPCLIMRYTEGYPEIERTARAEKIMAMDVLNGRATVEELLSQLTDRELAMLCVGATRMGKTGSVIGTSSSNAPGAAGDSCATLEDGRGIRSMAFADGPAGVRLTTVFHEKDGQLIPETPAPTPDFELILQYLPVEAAPKPDLTGATAHYQYCTAIPIGTLLAQTWDYELIRAAGDLVGAEMEEFNVSLWLAPGMDIHRDPLCGRNFEYYSEDPLITGMSAAAVTEGVQRHHGVGTTVKHFAFNEQEDNRLGNNSHVRERAAREIYLRAFEICIRQAQPMAIMSSYNLFNGIHTANNYDLLTAYVRDEVGFEGLIMTDWGATKDSLEVMLGGMSDKMKMKYEPACASGCIFAGNDIAMPGSDGDVEDILAAIDNKEAAYPLTRGRLQNRAGNVLRIALKSLCYENAPSYSETVSTCQFIR